MPVGALLERLRHVSHSCPGRPARATATDRTFDRLVREDLRHLSRTHWTPIEVAIRATALLSPTPGLRVLDVGAGVGKLCMVGALATHGMWCGIEQHSSLVSAARQLARSLGVAEHTMFLHGDALGIEWTGFDAIYLYNPFERAPFPSAFRVDMRDQVTRVEERLASLPNEVRVVTLNGFGGVMPPSYELLYHERMATGLDLVLWVQRTARREAAART
jgi:hypothetical protein